MLRGLNTTRRLANWTERTDEHATSIEMTQMRKLIVHSITFIMWEISWEFARTSKNIMVIVIVIIAISQIICISEYSQIMQKNNEKIAYRKHAIQ